MIVPGNSATLYFRSCWMGKRIIIYLLFTVVIPCWFEIKMVTESNVDRDANSVFHLYQLLQTFMFPLNYVSLPYWAVLFWAVWRQQTMQLFMPVESMSLGSFYTKILIVHFYKCFFGEVNFNLPNSWKKKSDRNTYSILVLWMNANIMLSRRIEP